MLSKLGRYLVLLSLRACIAAICLQRNFPCLPMTAIRPLIDVKYGACANDPPAHELTATIINTRGSGAEEVTSW
jgi:hypothetical protein